MENPVKQIYRFNQEAGLLNRPYNPWLESAYQIEEALEGFDLVELANRLGFADQPEAALSAKFLSRCILGEQNKTVQISEVDALDKAVDHVVYAIGAMAKLKLSPQQITLAINTVMQANFNKIKAPAVDAEGKLMKPAGFVGPEVKLQAILDSRI